MSLLRTIKQLVLGETWLLPLGLAAVVAAAGLLSRVLDAQLWQRLGGFFVLAGVLAVVLASVDRAACRARPGGDGYDAGRQPGAENASR